MGGRSQRRFLPVVASTAAAALVLVGCGADASDGAGERGGEIELGATATISGPYAGSCTKQVAGAQAWIDKVNAEGGVDGRRLSWTVMDDGGDPQRGVSNVRKLLGDGVVALFGNCGSAGTVASLSIVDREGTPNLFPNAASDALLHPPHPSTYTLMPLFDQQLAALIPAAFDRGSGPGTVAVVYIDGFSPNVLPAARLAIERAGGRIVADIPVKADNTNWGPTVIQLRDAAPDYVFIAATTPGSGQLVDEMSRQGYTPPNPVAGTYGMADDIFLNFAKDAAAGSLITSPLVPPTDQRATECNATLPAGEKPSFYSVMGCGYAQALVATLQRAGNELTSETILEALQKLTPEDVVVNAGIAPSDTHLFTDKLFLWTVAPDGTFTLASDEPIAIPPNSDWVTHG